MKTPSVAIESAHVGRAAALAGAGVFLGGLAILWAQAEENCGNVNSPRADPRIRRSNAVMLATHALSGRAIPVLRLPFGELYFTRKGTLGGDYIALWKRVRGALGPIAKEMLPDEEWELPEPKDEQ